MFYYHIGTLTKEYGILEYCKKQSAINKSLIVFVSTSLLLLSIYVFRLSGSNMNLSALNTPFFPIDFLNAIGLTLSLYFLVCYFKRFKALIYINDGLKWCGENSMAIFAVHCVEYQTSIPLMSKIAEILM